MVALSPTEEQLCALLVGEFGQVVSDRALISQAWPEGTGTPTGLRLQMTRLRRVRRLGALMLVPYQERVRNLEHGVKGASMQFRADRAGRRR